MEYGPVYEPRLNIKHPPIGGCDRDAIKLICSWSRRKVATLFSRHRSRKISLGKQARSHGKQSTCTQMNIGLAVRRSAEFDPAQWAWVLCVSRRGSREWLHDGLDEQSLAREPINRGTHLNKLSWCEPGCKP